MKKGKLRYLVTAFLMLFSTVTPLGRVIPAAYAAEGKADATNTSDYARLWNTIASRAVNVSEANKGIVNYNPNTCAEVYNDRSLMNRVFIVNTMALGAKNMDSVIVTPDSGMFHETTTYPRIVYRSSSADDQLYDSGEFLNIINATNYKVNRVEGLFVLAVNDSTGTTIVSDESGETYSVSAYIDFYIRSCWYAVNAERPSTISTVIRLYNPNSVAI